VKTNSIEKNYTEVIILEKGVKRKIVIPQTDKSLNKFTPYSSKKLTEKKGLLVVFDHPLSKSEIEEFEAKYDLKMSYKLIIGYYAFENLSSYSDIELIKNIIDKENNIKTIKPNWKMKNQPR
jgi:hypothetical protein